MRLFLLFFSFILFQPLASYGKEITPDQTLAYTVFIENRIIQPFFEDSIDSSDKRGIGIVIDREKGWVLTNASIVGYSVSETVVQLRTRQSLKAKKIYVDPFLDLAILQVDPKKLPFYIQNAPFKCDNFGKTGDRIMTLNSFYERNQKFVRGKIVGMPNGDKGKFVKTDLKVTEENIGGPLLNSQDGQVVGMFSRQTLKSSKKLTEIIPAFYTCQIVALLKEGLDPSPPQLPILFFVPEPGDQKLVVARSYFQNKSIELKSGDEILGVEGFDKSTPHLGLLVHALRGKLSNFTLNIMRDGEKIQVAGSALPHGLITKRKGVKFSGILIAPFEKEDRGLLGEYDFLQMHHVEKGSIGEKLKFGNLCVIMKVDGKRYSRVEDLHDYLKGAEKERRSVEFEVRWPKKRAASTYFTYMKRTVPIEDVQLIEQN